MEHQAKVSITVETTVSVSPELAWAYWTEPKHITQWNQASEDWHTPRAENDLRAGGAFTSRMESKDGKSGFDFGGVYDTVEPYEKDRLYPWGRTQGFGCVRGSQTRNKNH